MSIDVKILLISLAAVIGLGGILMVFVLPAIMLSTHIGTVAGEIKSKWGR